MRTMSQRGWAPRPPVEQPRRTGKKRCYGHKNGVNMLQFCSVSNSLSHTTLSNKVRGIFFKRTVSLVFIVSLLWFCICICIVVHGYTTLVFMLPLFLFLFFVVFFFFFWLNFSDEPWKYFYHLEFSNNCLHCYIHNVSAVASFGLLKVFPAELGSSHRTSNRTIYLI